MYSSVEMLFVKINSAINNGFGFEFGFGNKCNVYQLN